MKKNYTLRLDPELVRRIDKAASVDQRTRTNLIEVALHDYLTQNAQPDQGTQR